MPKHTNVTRLKLAGGMEWETAENDIVLKAQADEFQGFMCGVTIVDQNVWLVLRERPDLRVQDVLDPVLADLPVGISPF